jgi:parallel beta-helix repeat protein
VDNDGTAILNNCTISGNSALDSGGGLVNLYKATLSNCTISGNSSHNDGGAVYNYWTATFTNCTISGNSASHDGGGVYNYGTGTATLSNCTISRNSAVYGGGVDNDGTATLSNCTLSGNSAIGGGVVIGGGVGAGVRNIGRVTLSNCTLSGNFAYLSGGGVYNEGTATFTNCTVSGNSAGGGGGVDNHAGTATLTNCSISGNNANSGGGMYNIGTATFTNCTISGNSATGGGGVDNFGTATLTNCTISGNLTYFRGGGVYNVEGTATLTDTIVAGNSVSSSAASDIYGTVTGSHNMIGTGGSGGLTSGQDGNIVLTSLTGLGLAPLAFYGGPTPTMALLPGSAAIGQGIAVSGVTTDQRGFPLDSPIDIGAFQTSTGKLVVNSTADGSGDQPGKLDLRGAVDLADVLKGAQTVTFDPTVFAAAQTILLTAGPLELSQTSGLETITGPAAGVTISGGGTSGVFGVAAGVTVSLSGLSITDGISNDGGGMLNYGTATLTNCTISGNSARFSGGMGNFGTATLINCTISGNSAQSGAGLFSDGKATLTNCTLSGNSAQSAGGVLIYGTATLTSCTISGNYASVGGDGGGLYNGATAKLTDTIVAGNTGPSSAASDIAGKGSTTGSHNLIGTGGSGGLVNGQNGNIVLTSLTGLGLAPLAFYGGPTPTMALLAGSAAIGKGIAVNGVTADQRGFPLDSPIDIGAFESQPSTGKLVVNSTADGSGDQPGKLDLRGAVDLADVLTGAQTITFDSTVFATAKTILLTSGPLELTQTGGQETVTAPAAGVTISGGGTSGVFQVDAGVTANLSDLTITGGSAVDGAGLDNFGEATLTYCTVAGNSASADGGGVNDGGTGTTTLTDCTISGNTAFFGGGLYNSSGTTKVIGCTVSGNTAYTGGGMFNTSSGSIAIDGGTTSDNTAYGATGSGGGIFNAGSLSVADSYFEANHSDVYYGGGLENYHGPATLADCTFSSNTATDGGGVSNFGGSLTAIGCAISGNSASFGGGLYNTGTETTKLTDCTISGNSAFNGGGVDNVGTATLKYSTISGNSAARAGSSSLGAGLFDQGTATLTNCTIAGNSAGTSGGGIEAQGTVTVTFSTFAGNRATYGGAIDNYNGLYTVTVEDSVLAGDSATTGPEFCNSVTSAGHNLVAEIDNSSGWVSSDLTGTAAHPLNALLAALGQYGGPTQTIALLPGSPALGTGISVSGVTTDQRGVTRPSTGVDIGAFQSQGFTLTPVSGSTPQSAVIDTAFANALGVTVTAKDSAEPVAGGVIAFAAPSSGASAKLSAATATIGSNGVASVKATANNTAGTYKVTASAAGAAAPASFTLTNTAAAGAAAPASFTSTSIAHQPVSSGLTNHTAIYGTKSVSASGAVAYGGDADFKTSTSAVLKQVVNQSGGSSPALAMGPSVLDQVLSVVQNESSQEVLLGDLAFEQLSSTKPRRK